MFTKTMKQFLLLSAVTFFMAQSVFAAGLSGKITFTGDLPEEEEVFMDADPFCMMAHEDIVLAEDAQIAEDGSLKNVFVYIKSGLTGTYDAPAEKAVIDQKGCLYDPHVMGVQVGQDLEIINSDDTLHNVHAIAEANKEFNLGMPIKGMKLKKKFDNEEVMVKVKCDVHPWMSAYIGVLSHPFFSVSSAEGSFEITDLPAGTYVVGAWHEKFGTLEKEVTIADGNETVDFEFTA